MIQLVTIIQLRVVHFSMLKFIPSKKNIRMIRADRDLEIPVEDSETKKCGRMCQSSRDCILRVRCVPSDVSVYSGPGRRWDASGCPGASSVLITTHSLSVLPAVKNRPGEIPSVWEYSLHLRIRELREKASVRGEAAPVSDGDWEAPVTSVTA